MRCDIHINADDNPTTTSYSRGTTYVASFDTSLPFHINIQKKVSMPFGLPMPNAADAIETGDEELDQMLDISGKDKSKIQQWLKTVEIKEALKEIFEMIPSVNINSDGLFLHELYSKADYNHIHKNLNILSEAILKIQNK